MGEPKLDLAAANEWKAGIVKQLTGGVAGLFKANGVEWVKGRSAFKDANTIAVEGGEDVTFKQAIVATGSFPLRPPIEGIDSERCVDSTGLLSQTEVPKRLVILGGGIIGCEFASIFNRFGSEVTIIEMLPNLIPAEDADAQAELKKQFSKRGIALHLESQCKKVEDTGSGLVVHFGEGEKVEADLMLVATGRGPLVEGIGLESAAWSSTSAGDRRRRASADVGSAHLRGRRLRRLLAARAHGVPRGRGRGRERDGPRRRRRQPRRAASDLHGSGDRRRRPDRGEAREQYGDDVAIGKFPWSLNGRAMMQDETVGWVKTIHETRYGEFLGLVMVGPHVTDLIEVGVVALDSESTIETVADGMTAHPTLSEAIKEAGLLALGRAIHMPTKPRAAAKA